MYIICLVKNGNERKLIYLEYIFMEGVVYAKFLRFIICTRKTEPKRRGQIIGVIVSIKGEFTQ
jgi:hypothetical protein